MKGNGRGNRGGTALRTGWGGRRTRIDSYERNVIFLAILLMPNMNKIVL